MSIDLLGQHRV